MDNDSKQKGFGFGLTSGIITTLGLMIGLSAGTGLKSAVLGGILTIAIADAMSDAFGVHISEEAENTHSQKEVWQATLYTFIYKFVFALCFALPVILLPLSMAVLISIAWGLSLLTGYSIYLARKHAEKPLAVVGEHLTIAIAVIVLTFLVGEAIGYFFD